MISHYRVDYGQCIGVGLEESQTVVTLRFGA